MIMRHGFLGLLLGLALTAQAVTNTTRVVQTDESGAVVKPANFWSGNQAALLQMLPPLPSSAVQTDEDGAVMIPGNFWEANQAALLQALALPLYVETDSGGVIVRPANFWQANRTALQQALPPHVQTDANGAVVSPANFWQGNLPSLVQVLTPSLPPTPATAIVMRSPGKSWRITIDDNGVLTPTAVLDVIVESRSGGQNYAAYSDASPGFPNSWANSSSKSTAPGCSAAAVGCRYNSNAGIGGATTYFQVAPTLPVMGGTYDLYVTVNSAAGANVVSTITQSGCTGLSATTTAFSVSSANIWTRVGTLTLNLTVTTPAIRFEETANDYRLIADAVKFVYVK